MNDPDRPDNINARMALVDRVKRGEITLAEAQRQLRRLKRQGARSAREPEREDGE